MRIPAAEPDHPHDSQAEHRAVDDALSVADLRVLAVCLFHMTGDRAWLEPPFRPARDVRLIADPAAGFDESTTSAIVAAAGSWLRTGEPTPTVFDPGVERFAEMLSVFLGEQVPDEYVPMVREDFGFDPADTQWRDHSAADRAGDVIVVGAGVSGLCSAAKLQRLGVDVRVIDKNPDVGGTWFENRYPGCGVDTPNHFYSFSFAPNPRWGHYFSPRDELHEYIRGFADDHDLRRLIEFDTTVTAARWSDTDATWSLDLRGPDDCRRTISARFVIFATGHFNQPVTPSFPGQDHFLGDLHHTAAWSSDVALSGKRVAVIGTGASAMQLVPTIANDVAALTVFQRTPQWVRPVPEYNQTVDPRTHWLFENVPFYDRWYRFAQFWRYGDGLLRYLRRDPDWEHPERSLNKTNDRHRCEMIDFITEQLDGRPDLIAKCIPSYPPFAKRILIDNGWYATLRRSNVELVTDPIAEFTTDGIRTADGTVHRCDTVIFATGFNVTDLTARIDVAGRDGATLADDWADANPRANLGMTVPGFPNMFVMYGPNTNMGHGGSGIWLAETQTRYITDLIVEATEADVATFECRPDRRDAYTAMVDALHDQLVWTHPGVRTYYRNHNGQVRSPMPFRLVDYWTMTRDAGLDDFLRTPSGTS